MSNFNVGDQWKILFTTYDCMATCQSVTAGLSSGLVCMPALSVTTPLPKWYSQHLWDYIGEPYLFMFYLFMCCMGKIKNINAK